MPAADHDLLEAARGGDEAAFGAIAEAHRRELHAHCYRMLGSLHDADDALQEVLLRAWRSLGRFEGRSSLRTWLYTIATNVCLSQIERRPRRVLPMDHLPPSAGSELPGMPVAESVWIEPYPDEVLALEDGFASPDAVYEQREGIELAFVAAVQHLPPNQRAVLLFRDVLGFSAKETAAALDTSVASANSALQRARAAVAERVPERTQQQTLRELGDDGLRALVDRYVRAWETCDVPAFAAMLTEDATFAMPPLATWYSTREGIAEWARSSSLTGDWKWRALLTSASGQVALGFYALDAGSGAYEPFALNVLTLRGEQVASVTAFIARAADEPDDGRYHRYPEMESDARALEATFARFALPDRIDA